MHIISRITLLNRKLNFLTSQKLKKNPEKPYINLEIKEQIKRIHAFQKKYRKYPITYGEEYRKVRNDLNNKITQAKK